MTDRWGADVAISMPVPPTPDHPILVDLEGFGFTISGIAHNINSVEYEELILPSFAPPGFVPNEDA